MIKGNAGNVEIVKDLLLLTGIAKAKVLAINPSLKELNDLGINFEKEIVYNDKNQEDLDRARIDVWVEVYGTYKDSESGEQRNASIKQKITFFLTNRNKINQEKTKTCYINTYGQTCWGVGKAAPTETWFEPNGVRICIDGEDALTNFLRAWVNADRKDAVNLDHPEAFFKGDYTELTAILPEYKNTEFKLMLTVVKSQKDGKWYQSIHNKFFARWNSTSTAPWTKEFKKDKRNVPRGAYTLTLQPFKIPDEPLSDAMPEEVSEEVSSGASKWNQDE